MIKTSSATLFCFMCVFAAYHSFLCTIMNDDNGDKNGINVCLTLLFIDSTDYILE